MYCQEKDWGNEVSRERLREWSVSIVIFIPRSRTVSGATCWNYGRMKQSMECHLKSKVQNEVRTSRFIAKVALCQKKGTTARHRRYWKTSVPIWNLYSYQILGNSYGYYHFQPSQPGCRAIHAMQSVDLNNQTGLSTMNVQLHIH